MLAGLKNVDFFPKTLADFKVKTQSGGFVTIAAGIVIVVLFLSELIGYLTPQVEVHLTVDDKMSRRLPININIEFPFLGCSVISIDAMDVSGEQQNDLHHTIHKTRIPAEANFLSPTSAEYWRKNARVIGTERHEVNEHPVNVTAVERTTKPGYCGSCYGAEERAGQCCNSCDEVREAYRRKAWVFNAKVEQCEKENIATRLEQERHEGCRIHGTINVQRVAGNFHFAPGKSFQHAQFHVHDFMSLGDASKYNMTHKIYSLSFGEHYTDLVDKLPLHDEVRIPQVPGMFQYYVKVVPTEHRLSDGHVGRSNQYSYTEHFKPASPHAAGRTLPGVFFIYDISPILVVYSRTGKSFLHFITQLCAVVGGVFTVAGMTDAVVYKTQRVIAEKRAVGKLG
jgi:hypothetical protein|eukprot:TRINITY_DN7218_c0_g2_i1.p1 TRINITY_DN7218_c0_g2~~TRINITY_DN7218_c0_g2_i1.p1  ORF type:complete len:396 (+),score=189.74 TRINITY_DN7218_c0_g2_i1:125-1312(+)